MRILIINPNSNEDVRRLLETTARGVAREQDQIAAVCAPSGIDLIVSEEDQKMAGLAVADCARRHASQVDGIIIGSFGDTGIDLVREAVDIPVVGIAQAAMGAAIALGPRPAIISFSEAMRPSFVAMLKKYDLSEDDVDIHLLPTQPLPESGLISNRFQDALQALAQTVLQARKDRVSCIIPGGAPLAGLAKAISDGFSVPFVDGTEEAVCRLIDG